MADVGALMVQALIENWMLMVVIITGVLAVVPWVALLIFNVFNKNIWREIKSTLNRRTVRILRILQNGQLEILYREMNPDRTITLEENKQGGVSEMLTPTTPPHPDSNSYKQNYICVQGQEGTLDLLERTKFDVNSPQKKMALSMSFEAGREFERYSTQGNPFPMFKLIIAGGAVMAILFVVVMLLSIQSVLGENASLLEEIKVALEGVKTALAAAGG